MTRKQLVSGLRSLHEDDDILNIRKVKRSGAIIIDYHRREPLANRSDKVFGFDGQLIIADPTHQPTKKPKG